MAEKVGGIYYDVSLDTNKLLVEVRVVQDRIQRLGDEGDKLQSRFTKIAAAVSAAISAIAIEGFTSKLIATQRQFDVMFASLKTMTGGADQAGAAFERLRKFAAQTPYTLEQSVKGFTQLKALGLDPSERAMTSFGNTAAAMGKDLTQMIEAVADASTGEFERLKEFGIKAKQEGDKVSFTFQGVTTTVGNNAAAITEYLTKIGEVNFAGAMSERMKTLDGDISNLQDAMSALYLSISQAGAGDAIAKGVRAATEAIQEMTTSVKEGGLTEYFDGLRPFIKAAEVAVVALAGSIAGKLVAAFVAAASQAYASTAAIGAATVAARGFTAVLAALGGPIGIAVTGLALLALNWEKVGGQARDAATISEQAAERIAAALRKSQGRAAADLAAQMKEVKDEISLIDKELSRTGANMADPEQLKELRERRSVLMDIVEKIKEAESKTNGGAGRGRVNPETVTPAAVSSTSNSGSGQKFDSAGYLAGLETQTKEGVDRINAIMQEELRRNQKLLEEGKISRKQAAEAVTLIEQKAADDRQAIQMAAGEQYRAYIAQRAELDAQEAARKEAERIQGQKMAQDILVGDDPIARLQLELQTKSELLQQAYERDRANEQLYAEARVALEQQTAQKIIEIRQQQMQQQAQQQASQFQAFGSLFGGIADLTKTFAGKQSGIYKAMFAASKGFAIAESIVKIQQGIASAAALPFPANIGAMGSVVAATSSIISTIQSTNYGGGRQYGGPVTAGSLYRVNEGGRPEMFTASNGNQYLMPSQGGRVTPMGSGSSSSGGSVAGGGDVNVSVSVVIQQDGSSKTDTQASGSDTATAKALGERMALVAKQTMLEETRPNGLLWKLKNGQV